MQQQKQETVDQLVRGDEQLLSAKKVTLVHGEGRLLSPRRLQVVPGDVTREIDAISPSEPALEPFRKGDVCLNIFKPP